MKLKLLLTLAWALFVSVNYTADNAVVLKGCDGATLTIDRALAEKSPRLKYILYSDDNANNIVTFQTVTGDSLQKLWNLLHFEPPYQNLLSYAPYLDDKFPKDYQILVYHKRTEYQTQISYLTDIFKQYYPNILEYDKILSIADEFSMSLTKEVIAQIMLSPQLGLKKLKEHKYVYSSLMQNALAIQLQRRIAWAKDKFFIDKKKDDPYFTGVSVQDIKDYRGNIDDLIDNRRNKLNLKGKCLNSLEGLEEILVEKQREGKPILSLDLSDNMLTEIPNNIKGADKIITLNLAKNGIEGFPDEFSQDLLGWSEFIGWGSLEALDLSENNIRYLPSKIAGLNALRVLGLRENKIAVIPTEFKGLESLQWFNLAKNDIREIPSDITGLSALDKFGIGNNPIMRNIGLNEGKKRKVVSLLQNLRSKRLKKDSDS